MFRKLKLKYAEKSLKKEMLHVKRQQQFHNFGTAKQIGIVYKHTGDMSWGLNELLVSFNTQHNIKVSVMAYTPASAIPSDSYTTLNKFIFCRRNLNWCYKPEPKEVRQFIETPFDMLIDFTSQKEFPLYYIMSLSRASMKIGRNSYASNPYDFVVAIPEEKDDAFYIEQLKHFLASITIKN